MSYSIPDRVMLKVSGEQLGSEERGNNFDLENAGRICEVIEMLIKSRHQVACVVGGGNIIRGAKLHQNGMSDVAVADQMGMLATVQNGLFLSEVLESRGVAIPRAMSKVRVDSFVEPYSLKRARSTLQKVGRVVVVCGGTGNSGFTTDTGTVTIAHELKCGVVVKTTSVDGVYTDDPRTNPEAVRIPRLTHEEALTNPNINVMDNAALAMARDHGLTIAITLPTPDHVRGVIAGDTQWGSIVES